MSSSITLVNTSFMLFLLIMSQITIFADVEFCCQWYPDHIDDYEMKFAIVGNDKQFEKAVLLALKEWQNGFGGIFSFTGVQDHNRADVIFRQVPSLKAYDDLESESRAVSTILGDDETGEISQVHVKVLKDISYNEKFAVIKHEIGHTFGLEHSTDSNNVIFAVDEGDVVKDKDIDECVFGMALTNNGLATYGMDDEC